MAENLGIRFYYKEMTALAAQESGSCVIVGRAADYVLKNHADIVRVFIYAPREYRINKVMQVYGDSREEAEKNVKRSDNARAAYYQNISGKTWGVRENYELMIDSSCGVEESAKVIVEYIKAKVKR